MPFVSVTACSLLFGSKTFIKPRVSFGASFEINQP